MTPSRILIAGCLRFRDTHHPVTEAFYVLSGELEHSVKAARITREWQRRMRSRRSAVAET